MKLFWRKDELHELEEYMQSRKPEFLVVYGRRRVGKHFYYSNFSKTICFFAYWIGKWQHSDTAFGIQ